MLLPVRLVTMPALVKLTIVGPHPAQADLAKTGGGAHQILYARHQLGMTDQFIKFRRGDQRAIVGLLVMTIVAPKIGVAFAILVKQRLKMAKFGWVQQLTQVDKAVLYKNNRFGVPPLSGGPEFSHDKSIVCRHTFWPIKIFEFV